MLLEFLDGVYKFVRMVSPSVTRFASFSLCVLIVYEKNMKSCWLERKLSPAEITGRDTLL